MATLIVMLRRDPGTGKQNIIVKLDSDPDALPMEHENLHRALVEKLVGKGVDAEDLGEIIIEREPVREAGAPVAEPETPQRNTARNPG